MSRQQQYSTASNVLPHNDFPGLPYTCTVLSVIASHVRSFSPIHSQLEMRYRYNRCTDETCPYRYTGSTTALNPHSRLAQPLPGSCYPAAPEPIAQTSTPPTIPTRVVHTPTPNAETIPSQTVCHTATPTRTQCLGSTSNVRTRKKRHYNTVPSFERYTRISSLSLPRFRTDQHPKHRPRLALSKSPSHPIPLSSLAPSWRLSHPPDPLRLFSLCIRSSVGHAVDSTT